MTKHLKPVVMENVRLIFRNFEGKEDQYNRAGDRNFTIILDPITAEAMAADGWNIKRREPREEGDDPTYSIQVAVSYKSRPPRVVLITSRGRTNIGEDLVETLDWADIANADVIISPYSWEVGDKSGVKAYLQSLYVTINEDELELKYADVPVQGQPTEPPFDPPYEMER